MIMNTMQMVCSSCAGIGHTVVWKIVSTDSDSDISTMEKEKIMYECCKGKGYTEYAVFSVDEAKAILKHCGLSTES